MLKFVMLFLALSSVAYPQATTVSSAGRPAPTLSGTGVPSARFTCSAGVANLVYIQTDATSGRLWLCDLSTGTWAWDHLLSPIGTAITGPVGATSFAATTAVGGVITPGCYSGSATIPGITAGSYAAIAFPLGTPSTTDALIVPTVVVSTNTVTVTRCNTTAFTMTNTTALTYLVVVFAKPS